MRLPQHLLDALCFTFPTVEDFLEAFAGTDEQIELVKCLASKGLPPIVSTEALATMLGLNSGLIWSFVSRPHRHYNSYTIPKGRGERQIDAPRVALKVVQKWLSHHLARAYIAPDHVFGFVPSRSHIGAALVHAGADWAFSVDVTDFFRSTPQDRVQDAYRFLGYDNQGAQLLGSLSCFKGVLAQGAPTSPPLSNICFRYLDESLSGIARQFDARLTRYADDIVFSGAGTLPVGISEAVYAIFADGPWTINEEKTRIEPLKGRIKIHGLLVHDSRVRLTKGYRNKIRAYAHILKTRESPQNLHRLVGHVEYAKHVAWATGQTLSPYMKDKPRKSLTSPVQELEEAPPVNTDAERRIDARTRPGVLVRLKRLFDRLW